MTTKKRIRKIPPTEPVITVEDKTIDGIPVKLITSSYIGDTWTVKCPYCFNTHVVSFSKNTTMYKLDRAMVKMIPFATDRTEVCCHYYSHEASLTEDGHSQVTIQWRDLDKKTLKYKALCPFCNTEVFIFVQQYPTKYRKVGRVVATAAASCSHYKISTDHDYIFPQHAKSTTFKFTKTDNVNVGVELVEDPSGN